MWLLALVLAVSPVPAESRQMLLSLNDGWDSTTARVQLFERASAEASWAPAGDPLSASLGRSGLAWGRGLHRPQSQGPQKREGDGRSPAGVFDLRLLLGYDAAAPAGTRLPYRQSTPTLRCVDDAASRHYNALAEDPGESRDWRSAEEIRRKDDLYRLVVWVGHNDAPVAPGAGSCIFLHLRAAAGDTTSGCTAFDAAPFEALLRRLDPAARPVLVQLPESERRRLASAWGFCPFGVRQRVASSAQQSLEAVKRESVGADAVALLAAHAFRGLGGRDRIASCTLDVEFFVVEEQRSERLAHVPLDVVGEHAQEDVSSDVVLGAVVNGPHQQVHALQAAEGSFDEGQALVLAHGVCGRELRLRLAGADDVDPVQRALARDGLLASSPGEDTILDGELEVLAHLVAAEDATRLEADLGLAQRLLRSPASLPELSRSRSFSVAWSSS